MYWLLGYLAGACLAGFIFEICYVYIDSFYKLLVRKIDNAKDELRKTDDLSDEYEKASRSADRLWGEHRLDALREQNKLIEEQQELLREKQKQAENYMKQD